MFFIVYIFFNKQNKSQEISKRNFKNIIKQSLKKRKNEVYNIKNQPIISNYHKKTKNKLVHLCLHKCNIHKHLSSFLQIKKPIYPERQNLKQIKEMLPIIREVQNKINKNKNTYRSISNQTIIEDIAEVYANEILTKNYFNTFEAFNSLTKLIKIYKKEAEILNLLLISKLTNIYIKLSRNLKEIKRLVILGSITKKASDKSSPALIYGIKLLNKNSNTILIKNKLNYVSATTKTLSILDEILIKQNIIYRYILTLSKGL